MRLCSNIQGYMSVNTDDKEAKRAKLRDVMTTSSPKDAERVAALAQPEAWAMATREELRLIYLEFVSRVYAERGSVSQIDLKL